MALSSSGAARAALLSVVVLGSCWLGCTVDATGEGANTSGGSGGSGGAGGDGGSPTTGGSPNTGGAPEGGNGAGASGGMGGTGGEPSDGGAGGEGGGPPQPITVIEQIAQTDHDASDDGFDGKLDVAWFSNAEWGDTAGFQWALDIPQGANITAAKIQLLSLSHNGDPGAYQAVIRIEDTNQPDAFNTVPGDIQNRSTWTTEVEWPIPQGGLPTEVFVDSPDIAELIQHAVDDPQWQSGNRVSLNVRGVDGAPGGSEIIVDFDEDNLSAALISVTYLPDE